jgi:hypothetical protein
MRLNRVTITGADETVRPAALFSLSRDFPFVEWGILLSESRQGKEPRYPGPKWLDEMFYAGPLLSGHLCGQWSRDAIKGPFFWALENPGLFGRLDRIQFNGATGPLAALRLKEYKAHIPKKDFILQTKGFAAHYQERGEHLPQLLLDNSGGRGIELDDFTSPPPGRYCGFSGGLGPDNLEAILNRLASMPGDDFFWVDMETKVRTAIAVARDVFDLDKVQRCLEIARPFVTTDV